MRDYHARDRKLWTVLTSLLAATVLLSAAASAQFQREDPEVRAGSAGSSTIRFRDEGFGSVLRSTLWKDRSGHVLQSLSVCWETASPADEPLRQRVRSAVSETWQRYSALHFVDWTPCTSKGANIRIATADDNPHTKGLGNQLDNIPAGMVLNFEFRKWAPECRDSRTMFELCVSSIAVHEFGHAIGFAHEHNRGDREVTCTRPPQGTRGDQNLTPYDPDSVMNYCNPKYNNLGKLSIYDVASVQGLYGAAFDETRVGG